MKEITEKAYQGIKKKYLDQIVVPNPKPLVQYLLCPIGLVGAGKTTVVKPLSEKLSLVRISADEIRKLFKEKGCGYEKTLDLLTELVELFIGTGYSVCIDSDCVSKIEQIKDEAQKYKLKIIWIHINPPEEFIINKLSNLRPNWLGTAEEMVENYYKRKPLHKNINLDFTATFDTSLPDIDEQIKSSVSIIEEAVGI